MFDLQSRQVNFALEIGQKICCCAGPMDRESHKEKLLNYVSHSQNHLGNATVLEISTCL